MEKKARFKVGDAVFYPSAGVGTIEAVDEIFLGGGLESCYVIRVRVTGVTIKVPVANANQNGLRALVSNRGLKEIFKVLSATGERRRTANNPVERCRDLTRKINAGDSMELGEVVRDLLRQKAQNGLTFDEVRLLQTASHFLSHEIALAAGLSPEAAYDKIVEHVGIKAA
jgi:CarD family transcriptional regulator